MTTTTQTIPTSPIIITNLSTVIKDLGQGADVDIIFKEFKWHQKDTPDFKETVLNQTAPMAFALIKEGSPSIQVVHSLAKFSGDPFNPDKYQGQI